MSLTSQQPPSLITPCDRNWSTILDSSTTDDSHLVSLMAGIHDPRSTPGEAAHSISHSSINVATGHQENGTQQSYSGLQRSLRGILLSRGVQYHALFPSYPDQFWPDEDKAMGIPNNSVERDIKRITKWSGQFSRRTLKVYRDCAANAPNAENLRKLLWEPRASPTFIYASGHTDCVEGNSAYLPSDCIEGGKYHPNRVVPYTEFQDKLTLRHHRAPVILVTDVCNCDNFLKLPYVYEYSYEDGKAICTETGYNTNSDRSAPILVHFAATLPGQSATFFPEFGSVYNSAVNAIVLAEKLSLGGIVEKVQIQMDKHLNNRLPQKHRVYSSHKFDGEDFFGTLGFSSKKHPSSQRSSTGNQ